MNSVLFLSVMNGSAWGGSEELWFQSAIWLAKNNYKVGVCCFEWPGKKDKLKQLKDAGCELYLLPGKNETKTIWGKWKLNKAFKKVPLKNFEKIVVNQGGWKDVVYEPFKKICRTLNDYVLLYHNYNANEKFSKQKSLQLQCWIENAKKNLGDTLKIFETLEKIYSLSILNPERLFNPLTFELPQTATPYPETKNGKYIFSVFAALDTERKAQDVLIKTLTSPVWRDRNWELHLYGEGKDRALLQKLIVDLQMQAKIFLRGKAADYKDAIRQSHIVLQITHIDAMPITVMDSMAMARPLVVSNVGDMPQWIKENTNGWITDSVSINEVNLILEKAWNQRHNWPAMGKESYSNFRQNFPVDPIGYFLKQSGITQ